MGIVLYQILFQPGNFRSMPVSKLFNTVIYFRQYFIGSGQLFASARLEKVVRDSFDDAREPTSPMVRLEVGDPVSGCKGREGL